MRQGIVKNQVRRYLTGKFSLKVLEKCHVFGIARTQNHQLKTQLPQKRLRNRKQKIEALLLDKSRHYPNNESVFILPQTETALQFVFIFPTVACNGNRSGVRNDK